MVEGVIQWQEPNGLDCALKASGETSELVYMKLLELAYAFGYDSRWSLTISIGAPDVSILASDVP